MKLNTIINISSVISPIVASIPLIAYLRLTGERIVALGIFGVAVDKLINKYSSHNVDYKNNKTK